MLKFTLVMAIIMLVKCIKIKCMVMERITIIVKDINWQANGTKTFLMENLP